MEKNQNKKISLFISMIISAAFIITCTNPAFGQGTENLAAESGTTAEQVADQDISHGDSDIVILYTNDIHTYIANTVTDEDGNESDGLSYASVAALRDELEAEGNTVLLADIGDHIQGTAYGAFDNGQNMINIMNAVGYDIATIGNHEFDYGQARFFEVLDEAEFPYVSCNFYNVQDNSLVLPAYQIFEAAGKKIAFVGISTPETIFKSTPIYFMDENQENYLYGFYSGSDGQELYDAVQKAVDEASMEADYVIALAHLGVNLDSVPYTSEDVISHTTGIDAVLDGHSHTVMECEYVENANGEEVLLSQTGYYFNAIGKLTITDDSISCELITSYDERDEEIQALVDDTISSVNEKTNQKIASTDLTFYFNDPEDLTVRAIRKMETNLGDLVADSYYYYLNEISGLDCDITIYNGGGIRSSVEPGDFTYLSALQVEPFGNVVCVIEVTGQQILDALECGCYSLGYTDEDGQQSESGGFLHVAGLKYTIDTTYESTLVLDENKVFVSAPTGEYRVKDVEVYNKDTGCYEPLDLTCTYRLGGINYLLRNQGSGMSMLSNAELVQDYINEDYLVLAEYVKAFTTGEDGYPVINSAGSPLSEYSGYLLDYENPYGSGRIKIISTD